MVPGNQQCYRRKTSERAQVECTVAVRPSNHGRGRAVIGLRTRRTGPRVFYPCTHAHVHRTYTSVYPFGFHVFNTTPTPRIDQLPGMRVCMYESVHHVRPRRDRDGYRRFENVSPVFSLNLFLFFDYANAAYAFQHQRRRSIHQGVHGETPGIDSKQRKRSVSCS